MCRYGLGVGNPIGSLKGTEGKATPLPETCVGRGADAGWKLNFYPLQNEYGMSGCVANLTRTAALSDLLEISSRLFASRVAVTAEDVAEAFRIRYQVYCEEAAYFDRRNYPEGLETDAYDGHSVQSLLVYRPTNAAVGTARLILPLSDSDSLEELPFDLVCAELPAEERKALPKSSTAELSRFCVTRGLKREIARTPGKLLAEAGAAPQFAAPSSGELARYAKLWLMRGLVEMSVQNRVSHWCAVIGPELFRALEQLGIRFTPLGPPVDYYGKRQPCWGSVDAILSRIKLGRREIWDVITDEGRLLR